MKRYERPLSEILLLNTHTAVLQDNEGTPNGSYEVNDLEKDIDVIVVGGDDDGANSQRSSLWDDIE